MKTIYTGIFIVLLFIYGNIFAKDEESLLHKIPWSNVDRSSDIWPDAKEWYENIFPQEASCIIPSHTQILATFLDTEHIKNIVPSEEEREKLMKYCETSLSFSVVARQEENIFILRTFRENPHPLCQQIFSIWWGSIIEMPENLLMPGSFIPHQLVLDKKYNILSTRILTDNQNIPFMHTDHLPECKSNIRLKK